MGNKLIYNIIFILAFNSFLSKSTAQIKSSDNVNSINFETNFTLINEFIIDTTEVSVGTPDVAFDANNYLVVWEKWPGNISRVVGARIATNGQVLDPQPFEIASRCYRAKPSISFDGNNYLVIWGSYSYPNDVSIYASRVTPSRQVIDSNGFMISPAQWHLSSSDIVFGSNKYYVVWTHWLSNFSRNVHGTPVTTSGSVRYIGGLPIGIVKNWVYQPSVSFDGQNYLVVCFGQSRFVEKATYIYGARVNNDGIVIDVNELKIYTSSNQNPIGIPHVVFGNGVYFVVWSEKRNVESGFDIFGSRVTPNGQVLDTNGVLISNAVDDQLYPLVEFDGINFIVFWADKRNADNYDVYCTQVTSEGVVLNSDGLELVDADYDRKISSICKGTSDQILLVGSGQFDNYSKHKIFGAIYNSGNVSIQVEANFIGIPVSGIKPLTVNFSNQSRGSITSYFWNFGDGQTSSDQNPIHTYNVVDTFTVSLTVNGPDGTDTETKEDYIIVSEASPIANFAADTTSGVKPLTVQFSDSSTGAINTWAWDFGDGQTSSEQNSIHTYNVVDTFTVSLTVTGPGGTDTEIKEDYIIVNEPTGIENLSGAVPSEFKLHQNYPNPFNITTNISFSVPKQSKVKISIYDVNGRLIEIIYNNDVKTGQHTIIWVTSHLPSGLYFVKLFSDCFQDIRKCLLLK